MPGNTKKRLVKSPKVYLRDTGLLHRLLNISSFDALSGNPIVGVWAVEIKRGSAPKPARGFHEACADVQATKKFVVYGGADRYPLTNDVEVIGLLEFISLLNAPNAFKGPSF